uniref:HSF-type DNA-binding domain-containing protein n=1 Tax=Odontella aurita TaxID=265563 RepID=A0A7S4JM62_9STRA|mmetsp:Transcript_49313/g.148467  ORF Transcript_49313/g.148467 Transcript_49313/m.148467 type:complete len:310 (+) Transcript_49313:242-1171(+)
MIGITESSSMKATHLAGASFRSASTRSLSDDISSCTLTLSCPSHRSLVTKSTMSGKSGAKIFPLRLHRVLSDPDVWPGAISWLPGGESFAVNRTDAFVELVLPAYFPECDVGGGTSVRAKHANFVKKLERWGFRRIAKGPNVGGYSHPLFKRGNIETCRSMTSGERGQARSAIESVKKGVAFNKHGYNQAKSIDMKLGASPSLQPATPHQFSSFFHSANVVETTSKSCSEKMSADKHDRIVCLLRANGHGSSSSSVSATPLLSKSVAAPKIKAFRQKTNQRVEMKPTLDRLEVGSLLSRRSHYDFSLDL